MYSWFFFYLKTSIWNELFGTGVILGNKMEMTPHVHKRGTYTIWLSNRFKCIHLFHHNNPTSNKKKQITLPKCFTSGKFEFNSRLSHSHTYSIDRMTWMPSDFRMFSNVLIYFTTTILQKKTNKKNDHKLKRKPFSLSRLGKSSLTHGWVIHIITTYI